MDLLILTIFTVLIFSTSALEKLIGIHFFNGFKQISILVLFIVLWFIRSKKLIVSKNYFYLIIILSVLLASGYFTHKTPLENLIVGLFMTVEFSIIFLIASSTILSLNEIRRFYIYMVGFFLINSIISLIIYLPDFPAVMRGNIGVEGDAGFFATGLNLGVIMATGLFVLSPKKIYIAISIFFSSVIYLTAIKKGIIFNLFIWVTWLLVLRKYSINKILLIVIFLFILLSAISFSAIQDNIIENINYVDSIDLDEHVRLGMYIAAFQIANDYFPFGSGAGSFASLASISNYYSDLYDLYGVSSIGYNAENFLTQGNTILDTYWPHILAEAGYFGFLIVIFLMLYPVRIGFKILKDKNYNYKMQFIGFSIFLIPLLLIFDGFALYTPEAPSFIIFISGVCGLCLNIITRLENSNSNNLPN